jgi:hypothetical protein
VDTALARALRMQILRLRRGVAAHDQQLRALQLQVEANLFFPAQVALNRRYGGHRCVPRVALRLFGIEP